MFDLATIVYGVAGLVLVGLLLSGVRVAQEYQRAVVFRLAVQGDPGGCRLQGGVPWETGRSTQ